MKNWLVFLRNYNQTGLPKLFYGLQMTTKQGSKAVGLSKKSSSILEFKPTLPAKESKPDWPAISSTFSSGLCTLPAITLHTMRAFLTPGFLSSFNLMASSALLLVEAVKTPIPPLILNPCVKIWQTPHLSEVHRPEQCFMPKQHSRVVPWNLSSSFPSARQRACFLASLLALVFTISRYSSNCVSVLCMLCTFKILSIPSLTLLLLLLLSDFDDQLVLQIISTMFLEESPSRSCVTVNCTWNVYF